MNSLLLAVALARIAAPAVAGGCAGRELAAGTLLHDGTVAGENEALAAYAVSEPLLHDRLAAMVPAERRPYARAFYWFQRPGPCRTERKRAATDALKIQLGLKHTIVVECREREYDAGTLMDDGSVAGETEALEEIERRDPGLHRAMVDLPREELRARYAGALFWFQRVGNCRTEQKAAAISAMKAELLGRRRAT